MYWYLCLESWVCHNLAPPRASLIAVTRAHKRTGSVLTSQAGHVISGLYWEFWRPGVIWHQTRCGHCLVRSPALIKQTEITRGRCGRPAIVHYTLYIVISLRHSQRPLVSRRYKLVIIGFTPSQTIGANISRVWPADTGQDYAALKPPEPQLAWLIQMFTERWVISKIRVISGSQQSWLFSLCFPIIFTLGTGWPG